MPVGIVDAERIELSYHGFPYRALDRGRLHVAPCLVLESPADRPLRQTEEGGVTL